jgi:hypothetical protein
MAARHCENARATLAARPTNATNNTPPKNRQHLAPSPPGTSSGPPIRALPSRMHQPTRHRPQRPLHPRHSPTRYPTQPTTSKTNMLISHAHRRIFIHIPKTGGTSIETALGMFYSLTVKTNTTTTTTTAANASPPATSKTSTPFNTATKRQLQCYLQCYSLCDNQH